MTAARTRKPQRRQPLYASAVVDGVVAVPLPAGNAKVTGTLPALRKTRFPGRDAVRPMTAAVAMMLRESLR